MCPIAKPNSIGVSKPVAKAERFYRPELDALRFGAFFLVFLSHWIPLKENSPHYLVALRSSCAFGVPIFFGLSSFLITELLLREKASRGYINLRAFYLRRILRIWPLYFAVLFGGFLVARVTHVATITTGALLANVGLAGNIYTMLHGDLPLGLGVLWSIGIEEQFYLVWPSIAKLGNRKALFCAAICFWVVSQATLLYLCYHHAAVNPTLWMNTLTHVQFFGIGAAVSILLHGRQMDFRGVSRVGMMACGLALFYAANYYFNSKMDDATASVQHTYFGYVIVGIGTAMILLGTLGARVPSYASFAVYLGKISYGLYVYHLICIHLADWIAVSVLHMQRARSVITLIFGLGFTLLVSITSYRYFETPFLKIKKRFEIVKSRPV